MVSTSFNKSVLGRHQSSRSPHQQIIIIIIILFLSRSFVLSIYLDNLYYTDLHSFNTFSVYIHQRMNFFTRTREKEKKIHCVFCYVFSPWSSLYLMNDKIINNDDDDYLFPYCSSCSSIDQTEGRRNSSVGLSLLSKCHLCRFSLSLVLYLDLP